MTNINVAGDTDFKGTLVADPTTGAVRMTNAHPQGTYTITVTGSDGAATASKTFTLTVVSGTFCNGTVQFTNPGSVSAGSFNFPVAVAIGDFNNDGNQDFAAANFSGDSVAIRLGNGAGGFSGVTNVSTGPQYHSDGCRDRRFQQ